MLRPGVRMILVAWCVAAGPGCQSVSIKRIKASPTARAAGREPKEQAAGRALDALPGAWSALVAPGPRGDGPGAVEARWAVNEATRGALRDTSGRRIRLDRDWRANLAARGIDVSVLRDGRAWEPERFDEFFLADDFTIRGVEPEFHSEGLGVPMVGLRRFRFGDLEGRRGEEKYLMPRQVYPVTAVLRPLPPGAEASGPAPAFRLELHDPIVSRGVEAGAGIQPLASDLTTPLVYHFARSPLPVLQEVGLLDPQWLEKLAGLYMLHPYEPGKIPVVLVHGLRSSPAAWTKVLNELWGDPTIRDRYQFWLFLYPTGTPFPYSAAKLGRSLDELREVVDPAHADPAMDRTVLVGHSMGGLISKILVLRSGEEVWKLIGRRPFEELRATPERKAMLRDAFFFEPHPSIRRVVFIATPHRGSDLGDQFVGRLADRLIRLPGSLRATYKAVLAQNGPEFFTPEIKAGAPSSIDELRRDNELLMTLDRLPVGPGVEYHSIIGQRDPSVPVEQASDGVVPYASSHLDGASSELVVAGDHGCQDGPGAIGELRRILRLHLAGAGAGASAGPPPVAARPADAPTGVR